MIGGLSRGLAAAAIRPRYDRYIDTFDALSSRWQSLAGTLAVSGGALRAATLEADGYSLLTNGDFEGGATSWTVNGSDGSLTIESSIVHAGTKALKFTAGPTANIRVTQVITTIPGVTYSFSIWARGDGTNSGRYQIYNNTGGGNIVGLSSLGVTAEEYQAVTVSFTAPANCVSVSLILWCPATNGGISYADDVSVQATVSMAYIYGLYSPHYTITADVAFPAAGVVPRILWARGSDALNYVGLRVAANVAGNDTELVQRVAGAYTVLQQVDVDWTAGGTDRIRLLVRGDTIRVYHMKSGATEWTLALEYTAATTIPTVSRVGVAIHDATVDAFTHVAIDPCRAAQCGYRSLPALLKEREGAYFPALMVMFDDGNNTDHSLAYPYMAARGIRGTSYIIGSTIGNEYIMTAAQLAELDAAGWALGNHTQDHVNLTTLTQGEVETQLTNGRDTLIAAGVGDNATHVAYPYNAYNATVLAAMAATGMLTGRSSIAPYSPALIEDMPAHEVSCRTIDAAVDLATAKSYVAEAIAQRKVLALLFHRLTDAVPTLTRWNLGDFQALMDYIADSNVVTLTIDEFYTLYTAPATVVWTRQ